MLSETIFTIQDEHDFEKTAVRIFQYQYINNPVYQRFCNLLGIIKSSVKQSKDIPYLPIEFFKQKKILSSLAPVQKVFTSSGTTNSITSKHYINDLNIYENSFRKGFQYFYGDIKDYTVLALLPSYLERTGSSLVYMVDTLIKDSLQADSNFYLDDIEKLVNTLKKLQQNGRKTLLIGVTFALLDLIEKYTLHLDHTTIIMETGGMKGKRKEMIRSELHQELSQGFNIPKIHSEYGMTELLSQAYSKGDGIFYCPPWMKVSVRDPEDALTSFPDGKTGGVNIIDLANIHSCSFIATQDLGKTHANGGFEILGRFDHSDIRGCNLMAL
ncbi:acyltransferase [Aquimarina addita]|uniref:Acyltransferase n=1 Tax=Aquimarina addita TaxID=870485 RepID=A0ABP7XGJ4_9FLAO